MIPSEKHRDFILRAIESVQFTGDVKGRENVKAVLKLAEECLEAVRSAPLKKLP